MYKTTIIAIVTAALAGCTSEPPPEPASESGRQELAPGIEYQVLQAAEPGAEPVSKAFVRFEIEMATPDGMVVMSSAQDGAYTVAMKMLETGVPGLARAIAASPVGERRRWLIESEHLQPGFGQPINDTAIVDLVVLGGRDPLPAPEDVSAVPADAKVTDSGLAYRQLVSGDPDGPRPTADDRVRVHYTGWRAEDGEMFDSSEIREAPAEFPVSRVIPGWIEALQLMTPGDRFRLWIPGELAYDGSTRPGAPKGMLVFDVELLEINPGR